MTPQSFRNNWFALQSDSPFGLTHYKQLNIIYVENCFIHVVFLSFKTKSMSAWHFVFEIHTQQYHWVPFVTNRYYLPAMMQDISIFCLI